MLNEDTAKIGLNIPEPISITDIVNHHCKGSRIKEIIADDALGVLQFLLKEYELDLTACTLSVKEGIV